ncbi:5-hydroxytryptamine receptor 3C-like [Micropterus dolomieu]|uniref:5-hydroxytryptamine receptor 3C-like n=1 Tax=Micropterus dolomieu TaxID=147949 RepID=UPI001E8E4702|nr:5-hydroxytryptamine receptor 3C-like [Micropterus dolomieu]
MTEVKPAELIFICFMLFHGFVAALNCTSPTPDSLFDALKEELFQKQLVRPVKYFSNPTNVTIDITVVGVLGLDDKAETLTTILWQDLQWNIEGLSWEEEECGTKRVSVPRTNLWVPDIHITELTKEDTTSRTPDVYLHNTGLVFDSKPTRVVTTCQLIIYTFPFDIQNCMLTFGSFLHVDTDIRMVQGYSSEEILAESRAVLETNGEWELIDIGVSNFTLVFGGESYSEIIYSLILRRRSLLYVVNLLIPSCFLITVDLFSFLLPPHSVDRSSFKMTLILGYTVFLLIMNDLLPSTGGRTPLINIFFSISLSLMVASLLETVFITYIQSRSSSQNSDVPRWLNVLVLNYLAAVVCLPPKKKSNQITVFLHSSKGMSPERLTQSDSEELDVLTIMEDDFREPGRHHQSAPSYDELKAGGSKLNERFLQHHAPPPLRNVTEIKQSGYGAMPRVEDALASYLSPTLASSLKPLVWVQDVDVPQAPRELLLDELRKVSRDLMAIRHQMDKHFQGSNTSQEWQMIGMVIDRVLFGLYTVFISVSFITIISIWISNNSYEAQST